MKMTKGKSWIMLAAGALAVNVWAGTASAAPLQEITHADWMQKKGLVEGDLYGNLALDRGMTLAETVTMLARLQGETKLKADPANSHWASAGLAWALQKGYITAEEVKSPNAYPQADRVIQIFGKGGYQLPLPDGFPVKRSTFFNALAEGVSTHVTIAHMNDTHGHIQENKSGGEYGYAKIATLLKQWRQENANFQLFDAGTDGGDHDTAEERESEDGRTDPRGERVIELFHEETGGEM